MSYAQSFYETSAPPGLSGMRAWLLTHDHKRLGLMYLIAVFFWFVVAMFLGLLMRTELMSQGRTIMDAEIYNSLFTLHGVIMIFLFVIPAIPAIFGNFFLPIQLGTDDVFFPRLNLFSWYLFMIGGLFAVISLFAGGGFPDTGWTFYVPFSVKVDANVGLTVTAAFILGMSSMLTGLNFVTTFHRMRDKKMGLMQIPLFTWSLYATAWVQILATPVISITFVLIILERFFSVGLFDPDKGGDPLLYPDIVRLVREIRRRGWKPILNTNGEALTQDLLAPAQSSVLASEAFLSEERDRFERELAAAETELGAFKAANAESLPALHVQNVEALAATRARRSGAGTPLQAWRWAARSRSSTRARCRRRWRPACRRRRRPRGAASSAAPARSSSVVRPRLMASWSWTTAASTAGRRSCRHWDRVSRSRARAGRGS